MADWTSARPRGPTWLDGATGLARREAVARYVRAAREGRTGWDLRPPSARMEALVAAANAELAQVGAPAAVALLHELPPRAATRRAWFLRGAWCVLFDPRSLGGALPDEEHGRVASAVYHEARHVEQTFRVARKLAAEGAGATSIELRLEVPPEVAAAAVAAPLPAGERRLWDEAAAWESSLAGAGAAQPSPADAAADLLDEALDAYACAGAAYRWALVPESSGRIGTATLRAVYVRTRERVRRLYALHSGLPFERDAWATAALVQEGLGLAPGSPADVLAGLDVEERALRGTPAGVVTLARAAPAGA